MWFNNGHLGDFRILPGSGLNQGNRVSADSKFQGPVRILREGVGMEKVQPSCEHRSFFCWLIIFFSEFRISLKKKNLPLGWLLGLAVEMLVSSNTCACTGLPGFHSWLQLPATADSRRQRCRLNRLGPCQPHGRSGLSSQLKILALPSPGHCGHLRSESTDGIALCL